MRQLFSRGNSVARGLGWFSLGLGLAEVMAPRTVARAAGLQGRENLVQAYGWREIATGIGLLTARNPLPWLWARVGGDALDLATLGSRLTDDNRHMDDTGVAVAAVLGVTAVDLACVQAVSRSRTRRKEATRNYAGRTGLPRSPDEMRGAALDSFVPPADMRPPAAMQPYAQSVGTGDL